MPKALLYARLSQDRSGESTATARQIADCEAFATARGWDVVDRFTDADLSAYKSVQRPEFERLLESVAAGEGDVVIAWKLDRLLRRPREFERLWSVCETVGANVTTVRDGVDTTLPMVGKLLPRLMASFAEMESESISVRAKSKAAELAKAGRHHGGGTRPFGLSLDWSKIIDTEAELIREAATRILAGETLRGVAMDWNRRGIVTSTDKPWKPETLRQMLVSPRIAGLREHHGAIVGEGGYPAILSSDIYRRLEATLRQRNGSRGPQARRHLLSGILVCSHCGRGMVGHRSDGQVRYICLPKPRGCGRTKIKAALTDALVRDMILTAIDSPQLAAALAERRHDSTAAVDLEQLRADEQAMEQLSRDHYADRLITRSEYLAAREALEGRVQTTRSRLARQNGSGVLAQVASAGISALADAWEHRDLEWRRALIGAIVERITVQPAVRGRNVFDPSRLEVAWRY